MLIGIAGKAGVGKDTLADILWRKHSFTRIAFADSLKRGAQEVFKLTDEQTWGREVKEIEIPHWGMSPRTIFQKFGTECMQGAFGREVWLKSWILTYNLVKSTDHVVVPDVRFTPEAAMIRALGGFMIQVVRDVPSLLSAEAQAHSTEAGVAINTLDAIIDNNRAIADMERLMMGFLKDHNFA